MTALLVFIVGFVIPFVILQPLMLYWRTKKRREAKQSAVDRPQAVVEE